MTTLKEDLVSLGARLRQARKMKRLSLDALANLMKGEITKQSLSKYEKGEMAPSFIKVKRLAEVLGVDVNFFYRQVSDEIKNLNISFRKKSAMPKKELDAIKYQTQDEIERLYEISSFLARPEKDFSQIGNEMTVANDKDVIACAQNLREYLGLKYAPIPNVQELLESLNIWVVYHDGTKGFDGLSATVGNTFALVYLNNTIQHKERQRFTAMHELGHILFDNKFDNSLTEKQKETLCHTFASEMLLPSAELEKFRGNPISIGTIIYLQERYGISFDAIMYRLHQLEIINKSRYQGFIFFRNSNPQHRELVETSRFKEAEKTGKFTAQTLSKICDAVADGRVSIEKVRELRIPIIENYIQKA